MDEDENIEILATEEPTFTVARKLDRESLLGRLRSFRGRMPADFVFDRVYANSRE